MNCGRSYNKIKFKLNFFLAAVYISTFGKSLIFWRSLPTGSTFSVQTRSCARNHRPSWTGDGKARRTHIINVRPAVSTIENDWSLLMTRTAVFRYYSDVGPRSSLFPILVRWPQHVRNPSGHGWSEWIFGAWTVLLLYSLDETPYVNRVVGGRGTVRGVGRLCGSCPRRKHVASYPCAGVRNRGRRKPYEILFGDDSYGY
jgi:hypothetical protein